MGSWPPKREGIKASHIPMHHLALGASVGCQVLRCSPPSNTSNTICRRSKSTTPVIRWKMQDDTNQTQQPHPPKLLHIPSLWVDTLRNSILYGMYLYVLQPPKYSMVPPSPSLPSIVPPTSQVSAKPRFFTIEIKAKWGINQFLRNVKNKIQPVWYVHRTWLHMSLAPSSPCRSSFLPFAWGMRPCTLCAFFEFHPENMEPMGFHQLKQANSPVSPGKSWWNFVM